MRTPRKPLVLPVGVLTVLAAFLLAAVSCGGESGTLELGGSELTFATGWLGNNVLSPWGGFTAQFLVFSPLVKRVPGGEDQPHLARSWERSEDGSTWTVHLRSDVRWHDGRPFTARDVEFTLTLLSHPDLAWVSPDAFSLTVHDDSTYTIVSRTSRIGTPDDFWTVFYPRHLVQELPPGELPNWSFWNSPVGTGPYRHVRSDPGNVIELELNRDYFEEPPRVQRIRLRLGVQSFTALLSGEVDGIPYLSWTDLETIRDDPRFTAYFGINPAELHALVWNLEHPALSDVQVRRALTLAIDRKSLMYALALPEELPVLDGPAPAQDWERRKLPEPWPHDPRRAEALLEEAGWLDLDGNGFREKAGEELSFTTLMISPESERAAVFVQEQLARVGARMEVTPNAALYDRLRARDFDAVLILTLSHFQGNGTMPQAVQYLLGSGGPVGYSNAELDSLIAAAVKTKDPDQHATITRGITGIIHRDLPMTVLYPKAWNWAVSSRVRGLESPHRYDPLWFIEQVWVEEVAE
jgi:peptide/nickel transport system substrate-binding protein